jgi:uncharacterized NAD(P)/FAD-binding protein YdhS
VNDFVAIIGGGFSGCMVAAHLLRRASKPIRIWLIEQRDRVGSGAAYSTTFEGHLLNVPAARMSALPDEPTHFIEWLKTHGHYTRDDAFVPRKIYGEYIRFVLSDAQSGAAHGATLRHVIDEVLNIEDAPRGGMILSLARSGQIAVDHVVLATGNEAPGDVPGIDQASRSSDRYINDPWNAAAIERIGRDDAVLLVGTGLTMIDVVLTLQSRGHVGPIHAISRHGLLPAEHLKEPLARPLFKLSSRFDPLPTTARRLLRLVREEVRDTLKRGGDWRDAVDGLRPITTKLWQSLPVPEQERFLSHLRPYWDVHRHRAAAEVCALLNQRRDQFGLQITAGRILTIRCNNNGIEAQIAPRRTAQTQLVRAAFVVNCIGPQRDARRSSSPLLRKLLTNGQITPDSLRLGLACDRKGAALDAQGQTTRSIHTVGPLRVGQLWESVAVPELRAQASELAIRLAGVV